MSEEFNTVGVVKSNYARRQFREILDAAEHKERHTVVCRYDRPVAVVVPAQWYERALQALEAEGG